RGGNRRWRIAFGFNGSVAIPLFATTPPLFSTHTSPSFQWLSRHSPVRNGGEGRVVGEVSRVSMAQSPFPCSQPLCRPSYQRGPSSFNGSVAIPLFATPRKLRA